MYIIKNAFRCIGRSKGRNILIGIIALVIAISACIGLSIRQAASSARASAMEGLSVTATIQYDRASAMGNMSGGRPGSGGGFSGGRPGGDFNREDLADLMGGSSSLTLEEYQTYASAKSVQGFYYTLTAYLNGSDAFTPVSDEVKEETSSSSSEQFPGFPGGMGNMMGEMPDMGDFTVVGYSSDEAMADFVSSNASFAEGNMFDEGTEKLDCIISEELAMWNGLSVNDTITLTNPSLEEETYTLTVVGIYTSDENNDFSMSMFGASQDPANRIYMSANALSVILDASENTASDTGLRGNLSATYSFATAENSYAFEEEVRALGLDESYQVSSSDISSFESSLTPLNTLSTMAGWFLVVILIIGAVILVVLNIFNVRERKYEVGVLTAMGMKKWKVAAQFLCEILVVTMLAVVLGAGIGAVSSVPVTNALLEGQIQSQSNRMDQMEESFGRPTNMGGFPGGGMGERPSNLPNDMGGGKNPFGNMFDRASDYISEVDSAMNLTVVLQMIGVGLLLTVIASAVSVLFIMRYDPLKILANRD